MFELAQRVDYIKNLIADNDEYIKGKFDDEFIGYINELFAPWYNTQPTTNNIYETFITNGIYKLVFPNKRCIDISLFSVPFYEYLLVSKPSYMDWFAKHVNIYKEYFNVIKEHVDKYMLTHDIDTFRPILDNTLLSITTICYVYDQLETFWYYFGSIVTFQELMLLYFTIVSKYGKNVFGKQIVNKFKNKTVLYFDVYTIYTFLCGKFGINPGWYKQVPNRYEHIRYQYVEYMISLNLELFTEQYKQFKKHLHEYIKDILLYSAQNGLLTSDFIKPIPLCIPQYLNDKQITKDMNILQAYSYIYDNRHVIKDIITSIQTMQI